MAATSIVQEVKGGSLIDRTAGVETWKL